MPNSSRNTSPRADRSGEYWPMTIAGCGVTAVCVQLIAVTGAVEAGAMALALRRSRRGPR